MKRLAQAAAVAFALTGIYATTAISDPSAPKSIPRQCTLKAFKPWAAQIWSLDRWQRGDPKDSTLEAYRVRLSCAKPLARGDMIRLWHADQLAFYKHRHGKLWIKEFRPFVYPDGKRWAVPYPIAWCESGGDYFVGPSGAYGLIPPFPQYLPPKAQDEIAHRLYEEQGEGPWAPYESGCAYR